jgi:DNA-binding transcriptional MerR regulator
MDIKYQAGAFGPIGELQTLLNYWTFMEESDYPNASKIRQIIQNQLDEQQKQIAEQEKQNQIAQVLQQIGAQNGQVLPQM